MAQRLVTDGNRSSNALSLRQRLIAPCVSVESGVVVPDVPALLNRLLVFEHYILQSVRLQEFPQLVRRLGVNNVMLLLESGALSIVLNPTQFGQSGQTTVIRDKPALPPLSFSFSLIRAARPNEYIVKSFEEMRQQLSPALRARELSKLEEAIMRAILPLREDVGADANAGFTSDLRANSPVLTQSLALKLKASGRSIHQSELFLTLTPIDENDFKSDSNLDKFGISADEAHAVIGSALLAVGWLNSRIEDMRNHNALSGAVDDELPLFAGKYDFLTKELSPSAQTNSFSRVLKICELPSFEFNATKTFDMGRFLEVRIGTECAAFRAWLASAISLSDKEIADQVASVRARLGASVQGTGGKAVRLAIATALGLIPIAGPVVGAAYGVLDSFVMERIFPTSGPAVFLTHLYPSLFFKDDAPPEKKTTAG